jgi:hypothetical protein
MLFRMFAGYITLAFNMEQLGPIEDSRHRERWAALRHRQLVAKFSLLVLLPIALAAAYPFRSGAAFFVAFCGACAVSIVLRLVALYTACPACGWPFGGQIRWSRWTLVPNERCTHCSAEGPIDG